MSCGVFCRPEDKRVTSQLELAAKKLSVLRMDESSSMEEEMVEGGPSESESIEVERLDQTSISGTL